MEGADDFTDGLEITDRLILLMRWGDDCAVEEIARVLEIGCAEVERSMARLLDRAKNALIERAMRGDEPTVAR